MKKNITHKKAIPKKSISRNVASEKGMPKETKSKKKKDATPYDIIIVGAGPAGMSAAIAASEHPVRILLLEGSDKIGKKILITGNGRCNLTNDFQDIGCYRSDTPEVAGEILSRFTCEDTFSFFQKLGILTRNKNGYIYPYNEQASAVRNAFEEKIEKDKNITVFTDTYVESLSRSENGFIVSTRGEKYVGKCVIVTTGGLVGPSTYSDGSGYNMAKTFGHRMIPACPALTPLKSSAPFLKKASGVRNQARIQLLVEEECIASEEGELQWTDYGISGVAIFQLSRFAVIALESGKKVSLSLDLVPDHSMEELGKILDRFLRDCCYKNMGEILHGILPQKLIPIVLHEAGIKEETKATDMQKKDVEKLCRNLKEFSLRINGYVGYEKAQVTRGGISLKEVTPFLESRYEKGLYFAGEILDVDGTCGGYNLQWAFSSGNVAGKAAAHAIMDK